jgi:LysM repeat protein
MADKSTYTYEQKIAFIKSLYCPARQCADETGCSWQLILAQAAAETGWGEKILPGTNNIFNIKATPGWNGESKVFNVWEEVHGETVWVNAPFRVYPSILESLRDRQKFLKENPRYAKSGLYDDDVKGDLVKEAQALQRGKYATDSHYADKLKKVFDGKTMQRAISAAQKDGCKGCLPTINVYVLDAAKVKLANTKVRATQGSKTCELVTDENGHVQVQAALSGGQIALQAWSAQTSAWISIDEKITPTTPATVVTVVAPFLAVPTSTSLHQPPPSAPGSKSGTSTAPKPATSANSHQDGLERYTIKKGDTLGKIAKNHSVSYITLAHVNHISSPYVIRAGQVLKGKRLGLTVSRC